jgi:arginyl-tRNA synthetase
MKDNPDQFSGIDDPEAVAEAVGVGAIIFSTVSRRRMKDVEFDWDRALNFQGETGPYLQYTHARMASILRKASEVDPKEMAQLAALRDNDPELISKTVDISLITSDVEWAVIKELDRFESQISSAADQFDPSYVASYLIDLAAAANKFHYECRVINPDEPDLMKARLALSEAIRQVLNNGLALLCLNAPERM